MNFFLRAKHWQLFLLTFIVPIVIQILSIPFMVMPILQKTAAGIHTQAEFEALMPHPGAILGIIGVVMLVPIIMVFGWQYSVAVGLQSKLPAGFTMKINRFKGFFFAAVGYLALVVLLIMLIVNEPPLPVLILIIPFWVLLHLFAIFCMIHNMVFIAKTIRSAELGREAFAGDYIGYFFLIWFSIVGYWILQPKINELASQEPEDIF
jgi:hypothetical protein